MTYEGQLSRMRVKGSATKVAIWFASGHLREVVAYYGGRGQIRTDIVTLSRPDLQSGEAHTVSSTHPKFSYMIFSLI